MSPLAEWTTRDVWHYAETNRIPLLPLYEKGYTSIGCAPCTSLPFDPNDPRSGRWSGPKARMRHSHPGHVARRPRWNLFLDFLIAALIAMTGVGAGTITAPLLILFLHVPVPEAVGTALAYSAAVKLVVVPVQIWRRQVVWRTLGIMLLTGVPGVVLGTSFLSPPGRRSARKHDLALSRAWHHDRALFRLAHLPPFPPGHRGERRAVIVPAWLAMAMFPVGAEVGFSSSGAGALGTLSLLGLTALDAPRIVGTDLAFGLCLSLMGGGMHLSYGGSIRAAGPIGCRRGSRRAGGNRPRAAHSGARDAAGAFALAAWPWGCSSAGRR